MNGGRCPHLIYKESKTFGIYHLGIQNAKRFPKFLIPL